MRKFLLACTMLLAWAGVAFAQETTVSGKVTASDDGSVLPGVSISVKGTNKGTQTDINGIYKISVPKGSVLQFSFIGFAPQSVTVNNQTILDVQLGSDAATLQEVVVTALGIEKKRNELAYSAQKVEGESIAKARDANFVNSLSGKVAGLEIRKNNTMGGSTNIVLRGSKSLTGNNQALFVVDGVPVDNSNTNSSDQTTGRGGYDYGNAAADINPDDIADLTVLKGAAATALYGSRAANGVIMVTTKKGSKNKGIGVTVNTGLTVGKINKSTFLKYQKEYGQGYGAYYEDASGFFLERDIFGQSGALVTPVSEDASYGGKFDANKMVYLWDAFDPASPNYGKARPFVAAANDPTTFFQDALTTSNGITVDGTNDKGFFKLGYTRNAEKGIMPNSNLTKDLINFGSSYALTKKITISNGINFSNVTGHGRYGTGYDDKNLMGNFRQWWATTTDIMEQKDAYFRNKKNVTWNWADPSDLTPIYWDNPYFTRYENYENDNRLRAFGNFAVNYKIAPWIDLLGRVTFDAYNEQQEERQAVGSVGVSEYVRFNRAFREFNYDLMANINKKLSEKISLKGVVGSNIRRTTIESILARTNGGLVVPRLYALSNSKNPINAPVENFTDLQVNGIFANASLGYDDFLFLDLSIRRDESSTLPKGGNAFYYPAASLGFAFNKFIDAPWLTLGKVRANYAQVGNSAPPISTRDTYDINTPFGSASSASVRGTKNNPNLKPELTKSQEIGLEMAMFQGRLGFDATYYKTNTVDQIIPVEVSRATGYNFKYVNAGNIQNQGVEVSLYGTPVKTKDFSWTINVNWSRNRNKVVELADGIDNYLLGSFQGGVSINAAVGQPYGVIRGQNFVFNDKGEKIVASTGYYARSATSNEIIGNANPNWIGGVNNTFKYKNIGFSFLLDMRQGGSVFSLDRYYGLATGESVETAGLNDLGNPSRNTIANGGGIIVPGVLADGTPNTKRVSNTNYGVYGYARNPAAGFVYDASFIKLREVALNYSLPSSIVEKLAPFKGIDVSLIGRNLAILKKNLPEADPEDTISAGNIQGYIGGAYPSTRNIGFNVKFRF